MMCSTDVSFVMVVWSYRARHWCKWRGLCRVVSRSSVAVMLELMDTSHRFTTVRAKTRAVLMRLQYCLRRWNASYTEEDGHANGAESSIGFACTHQGFTA
jgi:hypothetical protein